MNNEGLFSNFDLMTGELPITGGRIVREAATLARSIITHLSSEKIAETIAHLEKTAADPNIQAIAENMRKEIPRPGEFVGKATATAVNYSDNYMPEFEKNESASQLFGNVIKGGVEKYPEFVSIILLCSIGELARKEQRILSKDINTAYQEIAELLDNDLYMINHAYSMLMFNQMGFKYSKQVAGIQKGASKGGESRSGRFSDIKDWVLTNWATHYKDTEISYAAAARKLYKIIPPDLLLDDEGNELLTNPPVKFADWIRKK
ncbi:hypothetical protein [Zhongshania borealis]|uniref:Uncharacterized protein n=1 Tax=Zhongshania borealis TaxID=889488 RepID=A0ABP7W9K7_9GAMM